MELTPTGECVGVLLASPASALASPRRLPRLASAFAYSAASTLFAVLGVVRAATDAFVFERTSNEILECLGEFSKQWDAFGEALAKVERNFETARNSFDDLIGPRRRMLERQIDRIDQLTIQSEQQPMLVDASAGEPIEISGDSA